MGNAISDLALATNLSTLPREFFTDYEEQVKPEPLSSIPSPIDYLLEKEREYDEDKTETAEDALCILPSDFFKDEFGIYFIAFPTSTNYCVTDVRAYVTPDPKYPEPHFKFDSFEILPKFQPL